MKDIISRILVAVDGSEPSMTAAEYAISIMLHYSAPDLIVLHVLPKGIKRGYFDYRPEDIPVWIKENLFAYKQEVQRWVDRIKERYQQQREKQNQQQQDQDQHQHQQESETAKINLKIDMVDLMASVAGTIVSYAEEKEVDLIVIGTTGMSGIKRMLLGSVAEGVVMYAHCPVLLVK